MLLKIYTENPLYKYLSCVDISHLIKCEDLGIRFTVHDDSFVSIVDLQAHTMIKLRFRSSWRADSHKHLD